MQLISSFPILHRGGYADIHRIDEGQEKLLKVLRSATPSSWAINRLQREWQLLHTLNSDSIRKVFQQKTIEHRHALEMEYIQGISLKKKLENGPFSIPDFLKIALNMASVIEEIHGERILHNELNPAHFILRKGTEELVLIDFGGADYYEDTFELEGTDLAYLKNSDFCYIAPEQTGRTDHKPTYASDLYALGVIFYELLTGEVPFDAEQPLEIIHAHIAKIPTNPQELRPEIPLVLSQIILKLLDKNPSNRYQSAGKLKEDLAICCKHWEDSGQLDETILNSIDFDGQFLYSEKLYGRELQINLLQEAFEKMLKGNYENALLVGPSGSGKSELTTVFQTQLKQYEGVVISGKFENYSADFPYQALVQALQQFVAQVLVQEDEQVIYWKARLSTALGDSGGVLTALLPELEWIIGPQAPVQALDGSEAQNRFQFVFRNFIRALADQQHPLVLVLDDLHLADRDSISLLQSLTQDSRMSNFLLIGTYREHATEGNQTVIQQIETFRKNSPNLTEVWMSPLEVRDIQDFLRDTYNAKINHLDELVGKILLKTSGNPLYISQLVSALLKEKTLQFNPEKNYWEWERAQFDRLNISGNVFELMADRVSAMEQPVKDVLKTASCIGNVFEVDVLQQAQQLGRQQIMSRLNIAVQEGLIEPELRADSSKKIRYRFSHSRIREAAYDLIEEKNRPDLHLTIGKVLLQMKDTETGNDRLFDMVAQLNQGRIKIKEDSLKLKLAALNLEAGNRAKSAAAFNLAFNSFKEGIAPLGLSLWEKQYNLASQLYHAAAEMAYLNGAYEQLKTYSEIINQKLKTNVERWRITEIQILSGIAQKHIEEALHIGLDYLKELGYRFPKKASQLHVLSGLLKMGFRLRNKKIETLAELPRMQNDKVFAAFQVLSHTSSAAYFSQPNLTPLLILKTLDLCLKHGNAPESAYAYSAYGFILCGGLGAYEKGNKFGELSTIIPQESKREDILYRQVALSNFFIRHWKYSIREIIPKLKLAYHKLLGYGDFEYGAYSIHSYTYFSFYLGVSLTQLEQEVSNYLDSVRLLNQPTTLQRLQMYQQAILNLTGTPKDPEILSGSVYREEEMIPEHEQDNILIAAHNIHFLKTFMAFLFENYEMAETHLAGIKKYTEGAFASYFIPLADYLEALLLLRTTKKGKALGRVKKLIKKVKKYADHAPSNFLQHYYLLSAEWDRVKGKNRSARVFYEDAIFQARKAGNLLDEAFAWETGAKFYLERDFKEQAAEYFQKAFQCYKRWGANSKCQQLEREYGHCFDKAQTEVNQWRSRTNFASAETIDFISLVKTLQSISTQIELSALLEKMTEIVIENAGASRGVILLRQQGEWEVVAERNVNTDKTRVLMGLKLKEISPKDPNQLLPTGIIYYVIRTKETLVLNEVQLDKRFTDLPYFINQAAKSIYCMPLVKQNQLIGVLYLENTLNSGAFTNRTQEGLSLLGGQLAISLENALLYEDLEEKNRQNTELLVELKSKVEEQEKTLKVFTQFVPELIVKKTLSTQEVSVWEGELREVVVMFCDIRGFTRISEEINPRDVVALLNEYYSVMTEIVQRYDGTVNQFIGDEIFASFGAMIQNNRKEINAVLCALEMKAALPQLNKWTLEKYNKVIEVGIGVNAGPVIAGTLGSKAKLAFSITGDTVNTGKRIESLTQGSTNTILISQSVYNKCSHLLEVKPWAPVMVKGKKKTIQVYEVLGKKEN